MKPVWLKAPAAPPVRAGWRAFVRVPPGDLLRNAVYRRLWSSILISSLGGQVTMLALPLIRQPHGC